MEEPGHLAVSGVLGNGVAATSSWSCMRKGEGMGAVGGKRGEIGYDVKSSSSSAGLSLLYSLAVFPLVGTPLYNPIRCVSGKGGVRGVIVVGVSGETNGPRPLGAAAMFAEKQVCSELDGEGDNTEKDGEWKGLS